MSDTARTPAEKQEQLFTRLRELDSLLVAFSGGADSAYLAWAAHTVLGERALAVTALSPSFSAHDRQVAEAFVCATGVRHTFLATHELDNPLYVANNADRCFHCKDELFTQLEKFVRQAGFHAIAYGINADDLHDFRPGHQAARRHAVLTPLLDAALSKADIRELSARAGLITWDRPASPCLASRVPYGTPVTPETLHKIEEAESALRALGYREFRVRYYGSTARIEISRAELPQAIETHLAKLVASRFLEIGFSAVELDPQGYRSGSLNEARPADTAAVNFPAAPSLRASD